MSTIYLICAGFGGTIMVCQLVLTLIGIGDSDDVDVPHDFDGGGGFDHDTGGDVHSGDVHDGSVHDAAHHGSSWFFGVVTFRTVVAALAFFGLIGLTMQSTDFGRDYPEVSVVVAIAAGLVAMYAVHWMMLQLYRLKSDGTASIERSVGLHGTVYLRVPGQNSGAGKVMVSQQNRTVEYRATTSGDMLPNGAKIVVKAIAGPDTVEVELAPQQEPQQQPTRV